MALTRINPLHNLKKTANDLATFIIYGNQQELMECLLEAKAIYRQPLDSWLTGLFYRLMNSRTRFPRLDKVITQVLNCDEDKSEKILDIFSSGGWTETSFNTTLIRVLVHHLQDYDAKVVLPVQVIIELKVMLVFEQARLLNEDQISKQQELINILKAKTNEAQNDLSVRIKQLKDYDARCEEMKADEQVSDARLQELIAMCKQQEETLDQYRQQVKVMEVEKQKQEAELDKKKGFMIDFDIDFSKLNETQREEVKKNAAIAIKQCMMGVESTNKEKLEREQMTQGVSVKDRSKFASTVAAQGIFKKNNDNVLADIKAVEAAGAVKNNTGVRNALEQFFGGQLAAVKSKTDSTRKEDLKSLYQTGQVAKGELPNIIVGDYTPPKVKVPEETIPFASAKQALLESLSFRAVRPK